MEGPDTPRGAGKGEWRALIARCPAWTGFGRTMVGLPRIFLLPGAEESEQINERRYEEQRTAGQCRE